MTKRRFRIGDIGNKWLRRAALVAVVPFYVLAMIPAVAFDVGCAACDVFRDAVAEGREFAATFKQSWQG